MEKDINKSKKSIVFFILCIVIAGAVTICFFLAGGYGNMFAGSRDTYGADVTYRDDGREFPIAVYVNFDISHTKSDKYPVKTDDTGSFELTYDSDIESGSAYLRILDDDTKIKEYAMNNNDYISLELERNHDYTIEIYIEEGKGRINLMWMEGISQNDVAD